MRIRKISARKVKSLSLPGREAWILVSRDTLGAKTIGFIEVHIEPGRYTNPPHAHRFFEEVIYVRNGTAEIWLEGDISQVEEGEAVLIPTNAKHAVRNVGQSTLKLLTSFPCPDRTEGHVDYADCRIAEWNKSG